MTLVNQPEGGTLTDGPTWSSFDELRGRHAENLAAIKPGRVGRLRVKREAFCIVREQDFDQLQAEFVRAKLEIEQLAVQFGLMEKSADAAVQHLDKPTVEVLAGLVRLVGEKLQTMTQPSVRGSH